MLMICAVVAGACGGDSATGPTPPAGGPSPSPSPTPRPARLAALTFDRPSITGGQQATARIQLTGPAPDGGFPVTLSSSADALTVPAGVTVAAGQATADVSISTKVTPTDTNVTLTALADAIVQTATIDVQALGVLDLLDTPVSRKYLYSGGGWQIQGTLREHATSLTIMELRSSNPAALEPSGPMQFGSGTVQQRVNLIAKAVADDTPVTITATSGGQTRRLEFVVTPPPSVRVITESGTQSQTSPTALFLMTGRASCGGRGIHMNVPSPSGSTWLIDVIAPAGSVIRPGAYNDAVSDSNDRSHPQAFVSGANWFSCFPPPTGRFVVDLADYDTALPSARLRRFRGVIELSCPNARNLRAEISVVEPGFSRVSDSCF
jgi:hypothetical protein